MNEGAENVKNSCLARFHHMSDLTCGPEANAQGSYPSYNPNQITYPTPNPHASSHQHNQPPQIGTGSETAVFTIDSFWTTVASVFTVLVLGALAYMHLWSKSEKNQNTPPVHKRSKGKRALNEDGEELRMKQDGARMEQYETIMDTGDRNIPNHDTVNTDEKDVVLRRMGEGMVRIEGMLEQQQKQMAEYQARLEYQLKQVRQDLTTMQHTDLQREQEEHQTGLENEVKRLQKELAAFRQQSTQPQSEQKAMEHRTGSDELQRLRNELELSTQRERAREKQYQTDLERAEMKYQTEIEKWVKEVASSKEETDALRKLAEQPTTEKQRNMAEQARTWRAAASKTEGRLREVERERDSLKTRNDALVTQMSEKSSTSVSKVRQLDKEKQEATRAAAATTEEYRNLSTRYRQLGLQLDEAKKEKQEAIRATGAATEAYRDMSTRYRQLGLQFDEAKKDHTRVEEDYKRKLEQTTYHCNQLQNLLTLRTGELKGAQAFLGTADQFAGADLIKDLEQLNAEIMQLAASVADELAIKEKPVLMPTEEVHERARKLLGRRLVDLLTSSTIHDTQIVIQTAFQTAVAAHAHWIISAWIFEGQESEGIIHRMYESVRNAGKLQCHL